MAAPPIMMQAPTTWPFTSHVVPFDAVPSGSAYVPDSNGIINAKPVDVGALLGYGFTITGSNNTRSRVVDGTEYTVASSDFGGILSFSSDDPVAISVAPGLVGSFQLILIQSGAGPLTITGVDGATVVNRLNLFSSAGQYAVLTLIELPGTVDTYVLTGDLVNISEEEA